MDTNSLGRIETTGLIGAIEGRLVSVHVIARPHTEVDAILPKGRLSQNPQAGAK